MRCRVRAGAAWLLTALLAAACGSPPNKEMDQAQGAIDAARAAGADRFATTEYQAAQNALKQANDAVAVRDYRLALNHALVSREQAQNAARVAADTKARLRGDAERTLAEVTSLITETRERAAALPPARSRRARQALPGFSEQVQKASKEIQAEDFEGAQRTLTAVKQGVEQLLPPATPPPAVQTPRRGK
jgi:murein L,D-transpeptidase YcbB/YkuD